MPSTKMLFGFALLFTSISVFAASLPDGLQFTPRVNISERDLEAGPIWSLADMVRLQSESIGTDTDILSKVNTDHLGYNLNSVQIRDAHLQASEVDQRDFATLQKRDYSICYPVPGQPWIRGFTLGAWRAYEFLRMLGKEMVLPAGPPGKCRWATCAYDLGIWICSDNPSELHILTKDIAQQILNLIWDCEVVLNGRDYEICGQRFISEGNWNIYMTFIVCPPGTEL